MIDQKIRADQKALDKMIPSLIAEGHAGKFVMFKDKKVHGFFSEETDAFDAGIAQFGLGIPFVVDRVAEKKPTCVSVSWDLGLMLVAR